MSRLGAVVAVLALVGLVACQRGGAMVGQSAPEFSLTDLAGTTVRLGNLRGRVVFLNIWATWCGPCRAEMPSMQALYAALAGPDFEMLAVSADQEGRAVVDRFVQEHRLTFPVLLDPDLQVASRYRVTGYPETFVIDRNGTIVAHEIGPRDWAAPGAIAALKGLIERGEWRGL